MGIKSPQPRQSAVIPGYTGHVPRVKVNNQYLGKRMTEQSRDVLKDQVVDTPANNFATTGFNKALIPRDDKTMEVRSRRYGTRTMFNTAANHQPENYHETTTRASYHNPKTHDKPNYRSRDHSQVFENSAKLLVHKRSDSMASGYETNRQLWDGTGWGTEKNLHSDMYRTAYRNNFNQPKPFHKPELKVTNGRLIRKEQVFDVTDK